MELRYTTGLDDQMAFFDYAVASLPEQRRDAQAMRIVLSVVSVLGGFGVALGAMWIISGSDVTVHVNVIGLGALFNVWVGNLTFPVLTGLLGGFFMYRHYPKELRKQYREKNMGIYADADGEANDKAGWLEITPETLNSEDERCKQQILWPAVDKVVTTPSHTFIIHLSALVFIVPKAKVIDGDYDAFLETLYQQLA